MLIDVSVKEPAGQEEWSTLGIHLSGNFSFFDHFFFNTFHTKTLTVSYFFEPLERYN